MRNPAGREDVNNFEIQKFVTSGTKIRGSNIQGPTFAGPTDRDQHSRDQHSRDQYSRYPETIRYYSLFIIT